MDKENHTTVVDQKWIQDLKNVLSQYADGNYELHADNSISEMTTNDNSLVSGNYNQQQITHAIDQEFVDINKQFSDLNLQYSNYSADQSDFRQQESQYREPIPAVNFNEPIPTISTDYNNSINYAGHGQGGYGENQPESIINQNEPIADVNGGGGYNYGGADYYNNRNDAVGVQEGTTADYDYWNNQQGNNEVSGCFFFFGFGVKEEN